jgi:hypothetical protein
MADMPAAPDLFERSIIGQRRALADWLRLQLYGVMWASTGIDQVYLPYQPPSNDFDDNLSWFNFAGPQSWTRNDLALGVIAAGHAVAGPVPLLLVNEPIFISDGENSDLRYNFWYPRWAYDNYRELLHETAADEGWVLVDLWDSVGAEAFTDSPVHITGEAVGPVAAQLSVEIAILADGSSD